MATTEQQLVKDNCGGPAPQWLIIVGDLRHNVVPQVVISTASRDQAVIHRQVGACLRGHDSSGQAATCGLDCQVLVP
jgi:hypothetical protein